MPVDPKRQSWMFMDKDGKWQGPFNITQIMVLGWIRPDTWMKGLHEEAMKHAKEEPLLKPLFDGQLKGLNRSSHNCPRCSQPLIEEAYEGTTVSRCTFYADKKKVLNNMIKELTDK